MLASLVGTFWSGGIGFGATRRFILNGAIARETGPPPDSPRKKKRSKQQRQERTAAENREDDNGR